MRYNENTYYIFVCATLPRRTFMGKKENYLVISSLQLKQWIDEGKIASKAGNDNCMNIFIYPDFENEEWIYQNKGKVLDLTMYWNNFSFIK